MGKHWQGNATLRLHLTDGTVLDWDSLSALAELLLDVNIKGTEARLRLEGDGNWYLVEWDTTEWDEELGDIQEWGCPDFPNPRVALEATNAYRDALVDRHPDIPLVVLNLLDEGLDATTPDAVGVARWEVIEVATVPSNYSDTHEAQKSPAPQPSPPSDRHFKPSEKRTAKYPGRCSQCREPFVAGTEIYYSRPAGACCLACGVADLKELTLEDYEREAKERWDYWHEEGYTGAYCPDCDMSYSFHWIVELGGRSSVPIKCPHCGKELGGYIEDDATLEWQQSGKV